MSQDNQGITPAHLRNNTSGNDLPKNSRKPAQSDSKAQSEGGV